VDLDLVFRTEHETALNPNHASRGFALPAVGTPASVTRTRHGGDRDTCSRDRLRRWRLRPGFTGAPRCGLAV